MIRVIRNDSLETLTFQMCGLTKQEVEMLEDIYKRIYGSNYNQFPKYAYLDLSIIRECLKLDMLEGVVYVDSSRIEENLQRLFGGSKK